MDGILIIKKEKNYTSHDVVAIVKKLLQEKVGHTGTLDPIATGVLPLLIGNGTKVAKYLTNHNKTYRAVLQLGIRTDTADRTGNILEEQEVKDISTQQIQEVFFSLLGKQLQTPPMYSAIKVKGKKLYEYARKGEKIEVKPREIEIYQLKLEDINMNKKQITFLVSCSKGTYIRTLCETLATRLGTIGCMKELERIQVGEFSIEQAITIEELKEKVLENTIEENLITIEELFYNKKRIILDEKQLALFLNGVKLEISESDDIITIYTIQNEFIGTGEVENQILKRDIILTSKLN